MRTTADFILAQQKLHFALYVKNVTPTAVSILVTPGLLDREDHITPQKRFTKVYKPEANKEVPQERPAEDKSNVDLTPSKKW
jgi:hypothetical protein